jgi:16S rRNA (cytosine1402-N4)-methyltransferase
VIILEFHHVSVLLWECIENLNIKPDGIYVDGTMGGGGHSLEIAKKLTSGRLICIDQDQNAHAAAKERLKEHLDKITFVHDNFGNIDSVLDTLKIENIDGMLLDIGVSSHQLDEAERGFSYQQDAPLDMRMDTSKPFSAYEVVNEYTEDELNRVIFGYGEERWARRIAQFIVKERQDKPIETTAQLVEVIKKAVPKGARKDGPHPAKRTFQAIRIEVNGELDVLQRAIDNVAHRLNPGGRLCIITFHSLEDRIVKEAFRKQENPCICPPQFPVCVCGRKQTGRVITRKPILPSEEELTVNPRSRSAKLRVLEGIEK